MSSPGHGFTARAGRERAASPVLARPLSGYSQELAVPVGGQVDLRCSGDGPAALRLARLIHGDPHPDGPGVRDQPVTWQAPASITLQPQPLDLGSLVEIPHRPALSPVGSFTLGIWLNPTRLDGEWRCIAAKSGADGIAYGLLTVGNGVLVGAMSTGGGTPTWCAHPSYLLENHWQFAALVYDADRGTLTVWHYCAVETTELQTHPPGEDPGPVRSVVPLATGLPKSTEAPLLLGALAHDDRGYQAHFDGKLARPWLATGAWSEEELRMTLSRPSLPDDPRVVAAWDLSREVEGETVVDAVGEAHGRARGCPGRAVTGPSWRGTLATLYTDQPATYDAVHLHSDDLDDAGWPSSALIDVPDDARPGIYVAQLMTERDAVSMPFIITPSRPSSELCVLLPTLTWQAYSSNRGPYSFTEDGVIDPALCLYDVHADGTVVNYCTRRKPTRSANPSRGLRTWGAHNLPADLYLIDWLEERGPAYDVMCDQQLHAGGAAALEPYRCLIVGSHPEYWTSQMLDALEQYLTGGGRVMYLGGNGLYWVTSLDSTRPHVMEVHKSGDGDFEAALTEAQPGQLQHSTTLEVGGLWSRRGRPARRLVGIEHAANVFVQAEGRWGFERLEASRLPQYAFIFDGVGESTIGDFGLNLGTAAAYEMDATHDWIWTDRAAPTVLARATHPRIMSTMRLPIPRASEMAFTEHPGNGAVFAAGSVTWTGSLSANGYRNNVSRITGNVLDRFLAVSRGGSVLDPS